MLLCNKKLDSTTTKKKQGNNMSVVRVLQLNNCPAAITSLFVEEYINFYFKHMSVRNVKKQCDLFKVNFCGCQQQKICTFVISSVSAI